MLVVRGVEPEARMTVDSGRKRQVADELTMRGLSHSTTLAAMLMMRKRVEGGKGTGYGTILSATEAVEMLDGTPWGQTAAVMGRDLSDFVPVPPSVAGYTSLLFLEQTSKKETDLFWSPFMDGSFGGPNDPRFVLQRTLMRLSASSGFTTSSFNNKVKLAALVVKAWNAWRADKTVAVLRMGKGESFPKVR
jgi:hypothetical protein